MNFVSANILQALVERLDQLKRTIGRLENDKLSLEQDVGELRDKLEEQGQSFQAQMGSKDGEIQLLLKELEEGVVSAYVPAPAPTLLFRQEIIRPACRDPPGSTDGNQDLQEHPGG